MNTLRDALERATAAENAKLSKASVGYKHPAAKPVQHCGICEHFLGNGLCEIVEGRIRSEDWCEKFRKAR